MSCKRSTLKKYKDRPSPSYPANECKGMQKKGSDGNWWISVPDRFGVYRWIKGKKKKGYTIKKVKISKTERAKRLEESRKMPVTHRKAKGVMGEKPRTSKQSYLIHNNGSRPFQVVIEDGKVKVYEMNVSEDQKDATDGQKPVYHITPQHIWVGDNYMAIPLYAPRGSDVGNSILLQIRKSNYVFIGHEIFSFDTGNDEIIEYYSPIGNSDVPYPYAVGRDYVYFLLDNKRVPVEYIDPKKDGYSQFYNEISPDQKKSFRVKMIHRPSN